MDGFGGGIGDGIGGEGWILGAGGSLEGSRKVWEVRYMRLALFFSSFLRCFRFRYFLRY